MVEKQLTVLWAPIAPRDLDRFAEFLLEGNPQLAARIAEAIIAAADILDDLPIIGRKIVGEPFRQLVIPVLKATYVLRYRVEAQRVVILRVFHGREQRSWDEM